MAMKLDQKQTITEELHGYLSSADVVYLTDFTGLTVEAIGNLRRQLRKAGAEYRVVKNTLALRALEGTDLPDLTQHLQGPTALVLGGSDPVAPAKVVREFAKGNDERPVVKIGVVDRRMVSQEEVARLASLPPRDQLLAAIAGSLTAGVGGIAGVLNSLIRDIAYMVEEVAKQGEQ
jgi:large subunit ribosomal protein L10